MLSELVSQSVFYQVLMLTVMVYLKRNISFKIDTEKVVLLQVKRKA